MGLTSRWVVNPMDFMKTVDKSVKDKAKDLAEQVFDGVVAKTPVWTGRARACWTLNEGAPVFKSIPLYDVNPLSPLPPPDRPSISSLPKYPKLYICNGQPYSVKLEYGYSGQAPAGMVRVTLAGLK
jgi:hypothetical protein